MGTTPVETNDNAVEIRAGQQGTSRLAKWLGAAALCGAFTLAAACGGGEGDSSSAQAGGAGEDASGQVAVDQEPQEQQGQQDPSAGGLLDEEGQLIPIAAEAGVTMEIIGDDPDCPFLPTAAVLEATGSPGFATGDFRESPYEKGQYLCEWGGSGILGQTVTALARTSVTGARPEQLDNPNYYGERAGGDYLMENQGPMGDFLEVWTSERFTSNNVAGDQSFIARGPYRLDEMGGNPFLEVILAWYTNTDPAEYTNVARVMFEAADANYITPPR